MTVMQKLPEPSARFDKLKVALKDGSQVESGLMEASWGPEPQRGEAEIIAKFRRFAGTALPEKRVTEIETAVLSLDHEKTSFKAVLDLLVAEANI
jgi:hypothetical protein